MSQKYEPVPESLAFFECWNPVFDWWNCSDLEVCSNYWGPSMHCIWIWIVENIICFHFLVYDFCESLHIFSLYRFYYQVITFSWHAEWSGAPRVGLNSTRIIWGPESKENLCLTRSNHCIDSIKWFVTLSFKTHYFENCQKCCNIMWWSLELNSITALMTYKFWVTQNTLLRIIQSSIFLYWSHFPLKVAKYESIAAL